jgi:DNA-binding transcriptional LysR family regulator
MRNSPDDSGRQLTTQQVRCFVAVASSLHFRQAAEELYLSQPAFSRQIARLESILGSRLLDRSTRKVALTPKGAEFLPYARDLIARIDAATEHLRELDSSVEELWLSHPPGMICSVEALLRGIASHYPDLTVYCVEQHDDSTAARVVAHLGLEHGDPVDIPANAVEFGAEPMNVLVDPHHRLASQSVVTVGDLAGETVVASLQCYPNTTRLALRSRLLYAGVERVMFREIPTGPVAWLSVMRGAQPTIVPAADNTYPSTDLVAVPADIELCPTLSLWWAPRFADLAVTVLPSAQHRLQAATARETRHG